MIKADASAGLFFAVKFTMGAIISAGIIQILAPFIARVM